LAALQPVLAQGGLKLERAALPSAREHVVMGDLSRLLGLPQLEEKTALVPPAAATRSLLAEGSEAFPAYRYDYARAGPAVLLLGDSFSVAPARLLGHAAISRLDWLRLQTGNEAALLAHSRSDLVIVEIVERMLAE